MNTIIKNTTLQNRSKSSRLSSQHQIPFHHVANNETVIFLQQLDLLSYPKIDVLYTLGLSLTAGNKNPYLGEVIEDYKTQIVPLPEIPKESFDLLGSTYQYLSTKKENLEIGAFYTGPQIAHDFVKDLDFNHGQKILDPACGSGIFLFKSEASPEQIYGVDFDPVAVMISKFNFFIKFPDAGRPNIFQADFFDWMQEQKSNFDYVVGNPPYGAQLDKSKIPNSIVVSGESFSYFIEAAFELLSKTGTMRFLVPESLLNVKRHEDIRNFLLTTGNLRKVKKYTRKFSGVMSDLFQIELSRIPTSEVEFVDQISAKVSKNVLLAVTSKKLVNISSLDGSILTKVQSKSARTLSGSSFGLGVVTGDNKSKLKASPDHQTEPIFTGKEVQPYFLLEPKWHLVFDRSELQQVAPEEIYRADVKLVYKTISKKLIFALDRTKSLTSNSANILIPENGTDPDALCVLLNSPLYTFLHIKMSGGVNKVGRENLEILPIPSLTAKNIKVLSSLLEGEPNRFAIETIDKYIYKEIFDLTDSEIMRIEEVVMSI